MYRGSTVVIVIPVHNEERLIAKTILSVPHYVDHIIAIDDGSTDVSWEALCSLEDDRLIRLRHDRNRGVGGAVVTGYRKALEIGADLIAVMDGDGQMHPDDLPLLLDPLVDRQADYVKGNRFLHRESIQAMPRLRYLGNRVLSWLTRSAVGCDGSLDAQCGYAAATSCALRCLRLNDVYPRYGFPNDILFQIVAAGLRIRSVPVRSVYGEERSGVNLFVSIPTILFLILRGCVRRLVKAHRRGAESAEESDGQRPEARSQKDHLASRILHLVSAWRPLRLSGEKEVSSRAPSGLKPRILFLTSSFPRWEGDGTCDYIRQLGEALAEEFEVTVLTPANRGSAKVERMNRLTVNRFDYFRPRRYQLLESGADLRPTVSRSITAKLSLPFFFVCFFFRSLTLARRHDLVVSHWLLPSGLIGACLKRLTGKPHLAVEHSGGLRLLSSIPGGSKLARFIVRGSDHLVTVSRELRDQLLKICPQAAKKTSIIPMGVDLSWFSSEGPCRRNARLRPSEAPTHVGLTGALLFPESGATARDSGRQAVAPSVRAGRDKPKESPSPEGAADAADGVGPSGLKPRGDGSDPRPDGRGYSLSALRAKALWLLTNSPSPMDGTCVHKLPESKQAHRILFLGRLTEVKGVEHLIRAVGGTDSVELVIAGDGEEREKLTQLSESLGIDAIFLGQVGPQEKLEWLRSCDVVVIPSVVTAHGQTEGLPVVCLEAMAAGKPVIASAVGGLPEIILDGFNGFLIEPGNVDQLREKLTAILGDEELRRQIGENSSVSVQVYDWPRIAACFRRVIQIVARKT